MNRSEAINLINGDEKAVLRWNAWRRTEKGAPPPDLSEATLSGPFVN